MAEMSQKRFAALLWPATPPLMVQASDNKNYGKAKDRLYRNPRHESHDAKGIDSDKHVDEYA